MILRLSYGIASALGAGYMCPAPGTWGTIPGVLLYFLYPSYILTVLLFFVGWGASYVILNASKGEDKDPSFIVIDEVVGVMLALMMMQAVGWKEILLGFVFFRVFDIFKPFPIGWLDEKCSKKGNRLAAFGIMIDDVVAGLIAGLIGMFARSWIS